MTPVTRFTGEVGPTAARRCGCARTVIDSGVDLPIGLHPVLGQAFAQSIESFSQAPASFPGDPVGVGATWTSVAVTPATDLATASVSEMVTTITPSMGRPCPRPRR